MLLQMMKGMVLRPPFLLALGRASSMAETSMLAEDGGSEAGYNTAQPTGRAVDYLYASRVHCRRPSLVISV